MVGALIKLARPHQWAKSVFVLIGPFFAVQDPASGMGWSDWHRWMAALAAAVGFSLASSGCYVFNDLADVEADRQHPRKRNRPIASGAVPEGVARVFGVVLLVVGLGLPVGVCGWLMGWGAAGGVGGIVGVYIANVMLYSHVLKRVVVVDVMSLSAGFVLRVLAGGAAGGVTISTWLLNVAFFLSMFLAFGKRLGERRTMGAAGATAARAVQEGYSDEFLRMVVVFTGGVTLVLYAMYVETRSEAYAWGALGGMNALWLTVLPATYCLMRAMLMVEKGRYDDPTELAMHDRAFQGVGAVFVALVVALVGLRVMGWVG